jgi:hypothetical protein
MLVPEWMTETTSPDCSYRHASPCSVVAVCWWLLETVQVPAWMVKNG